MTDINELLKLITTLDLTKIVFLLKKAQKGELKETTLKQYRTRVNVRDGVSMQEFLELDLVINLIKYEKILRGKN